MIKKGDIVFHTLSGLYCICENQKMERWMNMNPYYIPTPRDVVPKEYFAKSNGVTCTKIGDSPLQGGCGEFDSH